MSHHHKPHAVSEKMYIDTISSDLTNRKKRLKRKKKGHTRHSKHDDKDEKLYIDISDLRDPKRNKKLKTKDQTEHEDSTKLVIHTGIEKTPSAAATDNKKDMLVIEWVDIKQTRLDILSNYRAWTPARIVQVFRKHYTNN